MNRGPSRFFAAAAMVAALVGAGALQAAPVTVTKIGTWSTAPNLPNPGNLARGGKFVIIANYDTDDIEMLPMTLPESDRSIASVGVIDPARYFRAQLTAPGSFQLFVPLEGSVSIPKTIATQTEANHFPIGAGFAPAAEIQFFDAAGTQFRGFEFESDFLPGTAIPGPVPPGSFGLIFEIFTADVGPALTRVTNSTAQIIELSDGVKITSNTVDVRSENAGSDPGVFLSNAVPVVAEAGAPLAYSAASLTVTTNAGTAQVMDAVVPPASGTVRTAPSALDAQPRQADNDLGAARTDGEDFLTYAWTVNGAPMAGSETGERLNRIVQGGVGGPRFVNAGNRTVNDVNVMVGIVNSGLTMTTDTVMWSVEVTEAITGLTSTDTVEVGYANTMPAIANASATAQGMDLLFELAFGDADLIVNALIADFELLDVMVLVDAVNQTSFFASLIGGGSQLVSNATLLSQFGAGMHSFSVSVTDRALAMATAGFDFNVLQGPTTVPEPSSLALLALAAAGLAAFARRRRRADNCRPRGLA